MPRDILFLAHRVPYPPDKGDRIRSYHLLQHLWKLGRVHLGFITDEPISPVTMEYLSQRCHRVTYAAVTGVRRWAGASLGFVGGKSVTEGLFYSARFQQTIDEWMADTEFDTVVCFSSAVMQYVARRGLEQRVIADLVDVDSQKWFDYAIQARPPLSWLFRIEGNRVRRIEKDAARNRKVVLITEAEADVYRRFCPTANIKVVTNGIDLKYFAPCETSENYSCVFVGYLDYRANVLGLQWFCEHVWPRLQARFPAAQFQVVGRNAVSAVTKLGEIAGVRVVGEVPDVRPHVAAAGVVVVPLTVARGIQNKVLEAMSMGKAVVVSPAALNGIPAHTGRDLLCAKTPDEWVENIATLWMNKSTRQEIGLAARRYAETYHDWHTCLAGFEELA